MTSRDESRWVVLCRGVDFVGHHELVQNTAMHGQKWSRGSLRMNKLKIRPEERDERTKLKNCPEDPDART